MKNSDKSASTATGKLHNHCVTYLSTHTLNSSLFQDIFHLSLVCGESSGLLSQPVQTENSVQDSWTDYISYLYLLHPPLRPL